MRSTKKLTNGSSTVQAQPVSGDKTLSKRTKAGKSYAQKMRGEASAPYLFPDMNDQAYADMKQFVVDALPSRIGKLRKRKKTYKYNLASGLQGSMDEIEDAVRQILAEAGYGGMPDEEFNKLLYDEDVQAAYDGLLSDESLFDTGAVPGHDATAVKPGSAGLSEYQQAKEAITNGGLPGIIESLRTYNPDKYDSDSGYLGTMPEMESAVRYFLQRHGYDDASPSDDNSYADITAQLLNDPQVYIEFRDYLQDDVRGSLDRRHRLDVPDEIVVDDPPDLIDTAELNLDASTMPGVSGPNAAKAQAGSQGQAPQAKQKTAPSPNDPDDIRAKLSKDLLDALDNLDTEAYSNPRKALVYLSKAGLLNGLDGESVAAVYDMLGDKYKFKRAEPENFQSGGGGNGSGGNGKVPSGTEAYMWNHLPEALSKAFGSGLRMMVSPALTKPWQPSLNAGGEAPWAHSNEMAANVANSIGSFVGDLTSAVSEGIGRKKADEKFEQGKQEIMDMYHEMVENAPDHRPSNGQLNWLNQLLYLLRAERNIELGERPNRRQEFIM